MAERWFKNFVCDAACRSKGKGREACRGSGFTPPQARTKARTGAKNSTTEAGCRSPTLLLRAVASVFGGSIGNPPKKK